MIFPKLSSCFEVFQKSFEFRCSFDSKASILFKVILLGFSNLVYGIVSEVWNMNGFKVFLYCRKVHLRFLISFFT